MPIRTAFRLISPVIHAAGRVRRGMVLGVRVVLTDDDGRIALVRHSYESGWHFPGGGVERGETTEAAARREAQEEAGCAPGALTLLAIYNNERAVPGDHVLLYRAQGFHTVAPRGGMEIAERGWFTPHEAQAIASPGTRRRLAELFAAAPRDPYW